MSEIARVHQCAGWGYQLYINPQQVKALSEEIRELQAAAEPFARFNSAGPEINLVNVPTEWITRLRQALKCEHAGCTQTDGQGCSYAECPTKVFDGGGA